MKMHQHRKPTNCGNYQQFLEPSETIKSLLLHGRSVTKEQTDKGKIVGYYTHGWDNSPYWLDYVEVNSEVFLNDILPKFIADSVEEFKRMINDGRLKFGKAL